MCDFKEFLKNKNSIIIYFDSKGVGDNIILKGLNDDERERVTIVSVDNIIDFKRASVSIIKEINSNDENLSMKYLIILDAIHTLKTPTPTFALMTYKKIFREINGLMKSNGALCLRESSHAYSIRGKYEHK